MSNISTLFENLMTYNESYKTNARKEKEVVKESDTTLLNLTVEIPDNVSELTPEDVDVNVGVMNIEQNDESIEDSENDNLESSDEKPEDVTPDNEDNADDSSDESEEDESKEESLKLRKEAIRQKRLEAKALREAKKNDCEDEKCKDENCKDEKCEATDVETAKANIRKRVATATECVQKNESLMHLDTKSLNKLFTEFVKENYKNIDKVVITKAMLENKMLKLEGKILNINGESTNISLTNRGFNPIKLENKRFIMDFKDTSNTFGIVKESLKLPFVFTCSLKEGVLTFEKLQYSYKTMMESKVARVSGKCTLTEGLFDKKTKDFVYKEMQKVSDFGKAIPGDDGLGFVLEIEAGVKEKLINDLKRLGYNGENGEFVLEKDKQKMKVTFKAAGELTDADGRYRVEFSARKKDVK